MIHIIAGNKYYAMIQTLRYTCSEVVCAISFHKIPDDLDEWKTICFESHDVSIFYIPIKHQINIRKKLLQLDTTMQELYLPYTYSRSLTIEEWQRESAKCIHPYHKKRNQKLLQTYMMRWL